MNPASEDIKDILIDSSVGVADGFAVSSGWSVYISTIPDDANTPDTCIGIFDTGGADPDNYLGGYIDRPSVQVRIRGAKFGYQAAWDKAKEVVDALHRRAGETWNGTRYVQILLRGGILFVGYDDLNRPIISLNFDIMRST